LANVWQNWQISDKIWQMSGKIGNGLTKFAKCLAKLANVWQNWQGSDKLWQMSAKYAKQSSSGFKARAPVIDHYIIELPDH
jgi:hypothetical protein